MAVQVFAPKHLGDLVLSLPALRRLASATASVHVVTPPRWRSLLKGQGTWTVGGVRRGGHAVLFAPALRTALRARIARCSSITGFATDLRGPLLNERVPEATTLPPSQKPRLLPREHQADAYLRVVDAYLASRQLSHDDGFDLALRLSELDLEHGDAAHVSLGRPTVLLHPCAAGRIVKAGDLDIWAAQAAGLIAGGERVAITGGPSADDHARVRRLGEVLGVATSSGPNSLPPLVWAGLARRSGSVLAPDTGIAHVSAAAGVRTTVLFGPTDARRHRPIGPGSVTVVDGGTGRDCAPCYATSCLHGPTAQCLRDPAMLHLAGREVAWSA